MKKFLLLILLSFSLNAQSQVNLVLNPSFEDTLASHGSLFYLEHWIYNWYGGRGYFNINQTGTHGSVPENLFGYQFPYTGNAYCGIYTYAKSSSPPLALRNYVQTKLSENLIPGKKYRVAFHVSLGDSLYASNNTIGAYLAPDSSFTFDNGVITNVAQIQNDSDNDLSSKTDWILVCDTFVATGIERWMTIGNFLPDSLSVIAEFDTIHCNPTFSINCGAYYYIDDVSVTLIDETGIEEQGKNSYKLYPNPNNGSFELLTSSNNSITCEISDIAGRIIEMGNYKPSGNIVPFSFNSLTKGIYHLKVVDAAKVTTIKIVIN